MLSFSSDNQRYLPMLINDRVYGTVTIQDPSLIALISSSPIQRLKSVTMGGIVAILGISPRTSRYEHSIGAMLLVRLLGASLEEQASALLHDVSHTAFSHVIDYAFGRTSTQDYHDDVKTSYIHQTEIPAICKHHSLDLEAILDESRHSLLEQPLPRLCADRVDYTLRDLEPLHVASHTEVISLLSSLTSVRGRMAFTNTTSAHTFADAYMKCTKKSWSNPLHLVIYELCGHVLRLAFEEKLIHQTDIWGSDDDLWVKLQSAAERSQPIANLISRMRTDAKYISTSPDTAEISVRSKMRWIDPEVIINDEIVPLSSLSSSYSKAIADYQNLNPEIIHVRIDH